MRFNFIIIILVQSKNLFGVSWCCSNCTSSDTCSTCSNKTHLLTWTCVTWNCTWFTNMLVRTTSVFVIDRVHSCTTNDWPCLPLSAIFMCNCTCLKKWLFKTSTTSNNTKACTAIAWNNNFTTWWKLNTGVTIFTVWDNTAWIAWASSISSSITWVMFNIVNFCSFLNLSEWKNISDMKSSLCSSWN